MLVEETGGATANGGGSMGTSGNRIWTRREWLGSAVLAGGSAALVGSQGLTRTAWAQEDGEWKHLMTENGVVVWVRDEPGRTVPVFKGIGTVDAGMFECLAVLDDTARHTEWMSNCKVSKVVKAVDEFERYVYNRTKAPWPVSDRDVVVHGTIQGSVAKREVWSRFQSVSLPAMPPQDGCVRMPRLRGYYRLQALDEKRTRITYQIDADSGGMLPEWLVARTVRKLPIDTVVGLRTQVAKTRGKYQGFLGKYDPAFGGQVPERFRD